jgi:hypothetical protein
VEVSNDIDSPVEDAKIVVYDTDGRYIDSATTDYDGYADVSGLSGEDYIISISKDGDDYGDATIYFYTGMPAMDITINWD